MSHKNTPISTILFPLILAAMIPAAHAADSVKHSSQGSSHSLLGATHLASGAVKLAAGAVALPLLSVGASPAASIKAGESLIDIAIGNGDGNGNGDDQPLPIGDEVIVAGPSPKAMLTTQTPEEKR